MILEKFQQVNDYTTSCLLDYIYFKNYYKMIAIDLIKQQALDADPKVMQQINFNGNLENQSPIFLTIEEAKETVFETVKRNCDLTQKLISSNLQ